MGRSTYISLDTSQMASQTAIVVTTIFDAAFLPGYLRSIRAVGRELDTTVYIIADRETPASVPQAAERARREGFDVRCPALDEQEQFLRAVGAPEGFIPWNTDNRRNAGFLMALADGADVLISIDDDNYCNPEDDFVGAHVVGRPCDDAVVTSSDGWFNICDLLEGWPSGEVFPRGFPYYAQRTARTLTRGPADGSLRIAMNVGLWLDDPDVDAVARLALRPRGVAYKGPNVVLGPDTWTPINTQNTALTREAALCYYYVRMGYPVHGLKIDRFGDILSGYLTQKVMKHLGWGVRVGTPIVEHRRTPHDVFKDLYHELAGLVLIEEFVPWLREVRLFGNDPLTVYECLAEQMADAADSFSGFIWDDGGRAFMRETARLMREWTRLVRGLASATPVRAQTRLSRELAD